MKCCRCDNEAKWQDALRGDPISGGLKWCGKHAVIYRDPATIVPLYHDSPQEFIDLLGAESKQNETMKHKTQDRKFFIENNQLIGQSGPVPNDEPLFILRARDINAIPTLRQYLQIAIRNNANSQHARAIDLAIERFEAFQKAHPERMKTPDTDLSQLHDGKPDETHP